MEQNNILLQFDKYIEQFISTYTHDYNRETLKAWMQTKEGKQAFEQFVDDKIKEDLVEQAEFE